MTILSKPDKIKTFNFRDSTERSNRLHRDRQLWMSLKMGEEQALEELFHLHYALLYDYGLKLARQEELVRDCIQEIFAYIWEKRTKLAVVESTRSYLLVSLRRQLLKTIAKQQKRQSVDHEFGIDHNEQVFSAEDLTIFSEIEESRKQAFKVIFNKIPTRMREALYLKTYDGLTYKEIAKIMHVKPQVARNYVSEALQRLKELVD